MTWLKIKSASKEIFLVTVDFVEILLLLTEHWDRREKGNKGGEKGK